MFYAAFQREGLDRVGISRDMVQDRRLLRHVDNLYDALPPLASHVDCPIEGHTIVECCCELVPLLRHSRFWDGVDEAIHLAKKSTSFLDIRYDLFPYFHMCKLELEREPRLYIPLNM